MVGGNKMDFRQVSNSEKSEQLTIFIALGCVVIPLSSL